MSSFAGGFFYDLTVNTNVDKAERGVSGFIGTVGKLGGGIAALTAGAVAFSSTFRDINAISKKTGESAVYVRQMGQEFRQLGYGAEEGFNFVSSLGQKLIEFQKMGEGAEPFALAGINISGAKDVEDLIKRLREAYKINPDQVRSQLPKLGLSDAQVSYISQDGNEFQENRKLAQSQVKNTQESIDDQKSLSRDIAKLTASLEKLGQRLLKLVAGFEPLISLLADSLDIGGKTADKAREWLYDVSGAKEGENVLEATRRNLHKAVGVKVGQSTFGALVENFGGTKESRNKDIAYKMIKTGAMSGDKKMVEEGQKLLKQTQITNNITVSKASDVNALKVVNGTAQ
jgi:hypothetical protein